MNEINMIGVNEEGGEKNMTKNEDVIHRDIN